MQNLQEFYQKLWAFSANFPQNKAEKLIFAVFSGIYGNGTFKAEKQVKLLSSQFLEEYKQLESQLQNRNIEKKKFERVKIFLDFSIITPYIYLNNLNLKTFTTMVGCSCFCAKRNRTEPAPLRASDCFFWQFVKDSDELRRREVYDAWTRWFVWLDSQYPKIEWKYLENDLNAFRRAKSFEVVQSIDEAIKIKSRRLFVPKTLILRERNAVEFEKTKYVAQQ